MDVSDARRLKLLETENGRLRDECLDEEIAGPRPPRPPASSRSPVRPQDPRDDRARPRAQVSLTAGWSDQDVLLTEADAAAAARNDVVVITTAALAERYEEREPERYARIRQVQAANLRTLRDADVALAIGKGNPFGTVADEVEYLAGLDVFGPTELLNLATVETGQHLFGGSDRPLIEGQPADFVVLRENPLRDVTALRSVD